MHAAAAELVGEVAVNRLADGVAPQKAGRGPAQVHSAAEQRAELRYRSGPGHGALGAIGSDAKATYTPNTNFVGTDKFTFKGKDAATESALATATLIVDPDTGLVMPCGEPGEFCTRGYSVMLGYWNEPDKTAEAIDAARWMHTGDLATMDENGYCNIVGRIKDMVIRGGENVYPREIEEFLYTHPDIADVQVIGVPDARYGEELCAWVVARSGASLSEESVREYCQARLAHYKVPRYVVFTDGFPMTVTGKVQKFKMREDAIERLGLEAAAAVKSA